MERRKLEAQSQLQKLKEEREVTVELLNKIILANSKCVNELEKLDTKDFRLHSKSFLAVSQFQNISHQKLLELNEDLEQHLLENNPPGLEHVKLVNCGSGSSASFVNRESESNILSPTGSIGSEPLLSKEEEAPIKPNNDVVLYKVSLDRGKNTQGNGNENGNSLQKCVSTISLLSQKNTIGAESNEQNEEAYESFIGPKLTEKSASTSSLLSEADTKFDKTGSSSDYLNCISNQDTKSQNSREPVKSVDPLRITERLKSLPVMSAEEKWTKNLPMDLSRNPAKLKSKSALSNNNTSCKSSINSDTVFVENRSETKIVVAGTEESVDDPQPIHHMMERQAIRGHKRPGRPPRSAASKRGRRSSSQMEMPMMAPPQPAASPEPVENPDANMCLKYTLGVNVWKQWVTTKNAELEKSSRRVKLFKPEILQLTADELNYSLCLFVKEVRKPNGQEYAPDTIYYLCLGIQQYLFENGRIDNIFCEKFTDCLDEVAKKFSILYNDSPYIVTRIEEEHLWESKQLGTHSPHVLLSTLMFFNTKHFNLMTVDEHMQLSFSHIIKHWKCNPNQPGTNKVAGSRNVLLRFYPPQTNTESSQRKKKVYEQQENEENPLRCPVKLHEFYLSKCPESVKTRNDVFYLLPERSCEPDSPVWYSTIPLPRNSLEKMLHRVKMVKEINVALLTN